MKTNRQAIGIIDSGVGGMTILSAIHQLLPNEHLIWLKDKAHFPYGGKSKEQIVSYTLENIRQLIRHGVKAVVIACHTASALAAVEAKEEFDLPIIDMITPTVTLASKFSDSFTVIATEGTVNSDAYPKQTRLLCSRVRVKCVSCPKLASLVENNQFQSEAAKEVIAAQLEKVRDAEAVILGCTHYPIMRKQIASCLPHARLLDPRWAVAKELKKILAERKEGICA